MTDDSNTVSSTKSPSPATISRRSAAEYIGTSTRTFDRIQKDHAIPHVVIGKRRRYLLSDLDSYIKSRRSI